MLLFPCLGKISCCVTLSFCVSTLVKQYPGQYLWAIL